MGSIRVFYCLLLILGVTVIVVAQSVNYQLYSSITFVKEHLLN